MTAREFMNHEKPSHSCDDDDIIALKSTTMQTPATDQADPNTLLQTCRMGVGLTFHAPISLSTKWSQTYHSKIHVATNSGVIMRIWRLNYMSKPARPTCGNRTSLSVLIQSRNITAWISCSSYWSKLLKLLEQVTRVTGVSCSSY